MRFDWSWFEKFELDFGKALGVTHFDLVSDLTWYSGNWIELGQCFVRCTGLLNSGIRKSRVNWALNCEWWIRIELGQGFIRSTGLFDSGTRKASVDLAGAKCLRPFECQVNLNWYGLNWVELVWVISKIQCLRVSEPELGWIDLDWIGFSFARSFGFGRINWWQKFELI